MGPRYPSRIKIAAQRGVAKKIQFETSRTPPYETESIATDHAEIAISDRAAIVALELPDDLRMLLYMDKGSICIQYAHLVEHFATKMHNKDHTSDQIPPKDRPNINIDIANHTPLKPSLPSIDVLPYIYLYLTYKHVRFHFLTENDDQGLGLTDIAANIIYKQEHNWRKNVLESGNVKEVRVWWRDRCIDIVLRAGSEWATTWECQKQDSVEIMALKKALGLIPCKPKQWKGTVVVASVEV